MHAHIHVKELDSPIIIDVGQDGLGPVTNILATHRHTGGMTHLSTVDGENLAFWPQDVTLIELVEDPTTPATITPAPVVNDPIIAPPAPAAPRQRKKARKGK